MNQVVLQHGCVTVTQGQLLHGIHTLSAPPMSKDTAGLDQCGCGRSTRRVMEGGGGGGDWWIRQKKSLNVSF